MKTQRLGSSAHFTSRLAFGCMRLAVPRSEGHTYEDILADADKAVHAAVEAGYTLFDHADIYGGGECEKLFGKILKRSPSLRDGMLIATKCGVRFAGDPDAKAPARYDFSREHILRACEGSLSRLGIEAIDLYQLHRPDYLCNPEEVAEAFEQLQNEGKVRQFGVSNFRPSLVTALQSACTMPLVVNQVEIHLGCLKTFEDGTLDQCLAESITPLAWSPLGGGFLGSRGIEKDHPRADLLRLLDEIAGDHGVSRSGIALAWLLRHPAGIVPIVGSTHPERIADAARADRVELSREEWYRLFIAARGERLP